MKHQKTDTGWAWMVLAGASVTNFISGVVVYSAGIINTILQETYTDKVFQISIIAGLITSLFAIVAPLASVVVNAYSCKTCCFIGGLMMFAGFLLSSVVHNLDVILIGYGILAGTGLSFCYIPAVISIGYYFKKWRSMAFGILTLSAAVGVFSGALITFRLIETYALAGTFLILGGMSANNCFAAFLMRPTVYETGSEKNRHSARRSVFLRLKDMKISFLKLFRYKAFICHIITTMCFKIALSIIVVHQPSYAIHYGVATHEQSAFLITAFGITNAVGRVFVGFSTSGGGLDSNIVYTGQLGIIGLMTLLFPLYDDTYVGHVVLCSVNGFYIGGLVTQNLVLVRTIVGVRSYALAIGFVHLFMGIAILCAPALIGLLIEEGGTYSQGYIISGALVTPGALFAAMSAVFQARDTSEVDADDRAAQDIIIEVDEPTADRQLLETKT